MTLSSRISSLTGPDRAVDAEVAVALGWGEVPNPTMAGGLVGRWYMPDGSMSDHYGHPRFTASLDAAMSVVDLQRFTVSLTIGAINLAILTEMHDDPLVVPPEFDATAATPALALLAAALEARGL